jgi:hypothetical protein
MALKKNKRRHEKVEGKGINTKEGEGIKCRGNFKIKSN